MIGSLSLLQHVSSGAVRACVRVLPIAIDCGVSVVGNYRYPGAYLGAPD